MDPNFGGKIKGWAANPSSLVSDIVSAFKDALKSVIDTVTKFVQSVIDESKEEAEGGEKAEGADEAKAKEEASKQLGLAEKLMKFVQDGFKLVLDSLYKTIQKYEQRIKGVVSALSGLPSTPWHVTIGNPLRPIFSAGDMYTTAVTLTMG